MTFHTPQPTRSRLEIRIVADGHLRDGQTPPFRSTLEAHAYQHRRELRTGYGTEFKFAFRAGDVVGAELILPPGPDPFAGNPEAFARGCDAAAAKMTFHAPISSLVLLGDVARACTAGDAMLRVRRFIETEVLPLGLGVDAALHDPRRKGNAAGLHAHLLVSVRTLTATGFGPFLPIEGACDLRALANGLGGDRRRLTFLHHPETCRAQRSGTFLETTSWIIASLVTASGSPSSTRRPQPCSRPTRTIACYAPCPRSITCHWHLRTARLARRC